jgi:hypothetical protein
LKKLFSFYIIIFGLIILSACGKDEVKKEIVTGNNSTFNWKDDLSVSDIPDFEIKGSLNGKEVRFSYIVFEIWRGSNDNVLNFSTVKAEQQCGYIENYQGFQLINKGNAITKEGYVKAKFVDESKTYQAFFRYLNSDGTSFKSDAGWNCALNIDKITDKIVSGKVAICFNDERKSWIAGKFEAVVCNN